MAIALSLKEVFQVFSQFFFSTVMRNFNYNKSDYMDANTMNV